MKNILNKHKEELKNLVAKKGYWSKEVREFIENWECYTKQCKLHELARYYERYVR